MKTVLSLSLLLIFMQTGLAKNNTTQGPVLSFFQVNANIAEMKKEGVYKKEFIIGIQADGSLAYNGDREYFLENGYLLENKGLLELIPYDITLNSNGSFDLNAALLRYRFGGQSKHLFLLMDVSLVDARFRSGLTPGVKGVDIAFPLGGIPGHLGGEVGFKHSSKQGKILASLYANYIPFITHDDFSLPSSPSFVSSKNHFEGEEGQPLQEPLKSHRVDSEIGIRLRYQSTKNWQVRLNLALENSVSDFGNSYFEETGYKDSIESLKIRKRTFNENKKNYEQSKGIPQGSLSDKSYSQASGEAVPRYKGKPAKNLVRKTSILKPSLLFSKGLSNSNWIRSIGLELNANIIFTDSFGLVNDRASQIDLKARGNPFVYSGGLRFSF